VGGKIQVLVPGEKASKAGGLEQKFESVGGGRDCGRDLGNRKEDNSCLMRGHQDSSEKAGIRERCLFKKLDDGQLFGPRLKSSDFVGSLICWGFVSGTKKGELT